MKNPCNCVISFGFCRPKLLAKSILSIKLNYSTEDDYHHLLVVDRAALGSKHYRANQATIDLAHQLKIQGLVDELIVRERPFGTQQNIIQAVDEASRKFDRLFMVEDDLELTHYHQDISKIFYKNQLGSRVKGFSTYVLSVSDVKYSTFLSHRFSSQAWGIDSSSWLDFDLEYVRRQSITSSLVRDIVRKLGTDMPRAIAGFKAGTVDSWAIPWNLFNFFNESLMVYPSKSYVVETGYQSGAIRTRGIRFKSKLAKEFLDETNMQPLDDLTVSSSHVSHFSILNRAMRKAGAILA